MSSNGARGARKRVAGSRKRARPAGKRGLPRQADLDWEFASDDAGSVSSAAGDSGTDRGAAGASGNADGAKETAEQKRIRLGKEYLARLAEVERDADEDADSDPDSGAEAAVGGRDGIEERIARRLQEDVQTQRGRGFRNVAPALRGAPLGPVRQHRGHKLPVTSLALQGDDARCFTGSKDCMVQAWDVETGKKLFRLPGRKWSRAERFAHSPSDAPGHTDEVLAVAVSADGRMLASAGRDRLIRVWDARTARLTDTLTGHQKAVTALAFQRDTHTLFSSSYDRTVKMWNLDEMAYMETLLGHQSEITALDAMTRERAVSVGDDATARVWKIPEESQLVFRGTVGYSIDAVSVVNESYFASGGQDGALSMWHLGRKKPIFTAQEAHGTGQWITSVAAMRGTDLLASGSSDGAVRFWHANVAGHALEQVHSAPLPGVVNAMAFAHSGRFLVAGVGQEHRLGRWWRTKEGKNGIAVLPLPEAVHS